MNIASFTLLLVLLGCSTQVIILQSSMLTTIVSPAGAATAVSVYFNGLKGGIAGDGVSWIQRSSPAVGTTVYETYSMRIALEVLRLSSLHRPHLPPILTEFSLAVDQTIRSHLPSPSKSPAETTTLPFRSQQQLCPRDLPFP